MERKHLPVAVLVLGILSVIGFGCLTGLPAWLLGNSVLKDIENGLIDSKETSQVQVGRMLGMVTTCLSLCGFFILATLVALPAISLYLNRP